MDELKFRKWLNLTQQQYDIVKIAYRLKNRGMQPTPKNIQKEYRTETNKYLMKPNLFNILRTLQEKKVIARTAQAEYSLDQEGIRKTLENARVQITNDLDDVEKTKEQTEQFFREITYRKETPDIRYLEGKELYNSLAGNLQKSEFFYKVTDFPMVAYTREMAATLEAEIYTETIWSKLKDKKTRICYLTSLNMDSLFNHVFRTYGDPKTAYREAINCVEKLQTRIETHKNLDIRHTDQPHGLDVAITQTKEPIEFIMFTRDEHDDIQGGINIRSHKTSTNALRTFNRNYEYATPLKSPQGQQIIQTTKEKIKQKYGILGG